MFEERALIQPLQTPRNKHKMIQRTKMPFTNGYFLQKPKDTFVIDWQKREANHKSYK